MKIFNNLANNTINISQYIFPAIVAIFIIIALLITAIYYVVRQAIIDAHIEINKRTKIEAETETLKNDLQRNSKLNNNPNHINEETTTTNDSK